MGLHIHVDGFNVATSLIGASGPTAPLGSRGSQKEPPARSTRYVNSIVLQPVLGLAGQTLLARCPAVPCAQGLSRQRPGSAALRSVSPAARLNLARPLLHHSTRPGSAACEARRLLLAYTL